MPQHEGWDFADEFVERSHITQEEAEALALADEAWLARERAEHEALALSLEEELDALLETMKRGDPPSATESTQTDPPGWPNL